MVIVADVNADGAEQVAAGIRSSGRRARAAVLDVSKAEDVKRLIDDTFVADGGLDYLFNNAGIAVIGEARELSIEDWERVLAVNLNGVIYGTAAAYPQMIARRSGHIVNTASLAGIVPVPVLVAYAATKHAVVGLSASLRIEAAAYGVRVSAVCPGFVQTNIYQDSKYVGASREDVAPLVRLVRPVDATTCVRSILRGVARNRAIIVAPFSARLPWWVYRLAPEVWLRLARAGMKRYRKVISSR